METIEYGEHCFGSFLIIDGENLNDDQNKEEENLILKRKLIEEINQIVDRISIRDMSTIAEIIVQNNPVWEYDENNSKGSSCDQCGNFNYKEKYIKIDNQNGL